VQSATGVRILAAIHPFLFGVMPVLSIYAASDNLGVYPLSKTAYAVGIALAAMLVFLSAALVLYRDFHKSVFFLSVFLLVFYLYGSVFNLARYLSLGDFTLARHRYVFPLAVGLIIWLFFRIRRATWNFAKLNSILGVAAIAMVLMPAWWIVRFHWFESYSVNYQPALPVVLTDHLPAHKPDIYYIILDAYASQRTLERYFEYDNCDFLEYLRAKDFYVADLSRSNYLSTHSSLASSLNLDYLHSLVENIDRDSRDRNLFHELIEDNVVQAFLKQQGYTYIHSGSRWWPTRRNSHADVDINYLPVPPALLWLVRRHTMLQPFVYVPRNPILNFNEQQWRRVNHKFARLAEIKELDGPKFVFAHFLVPHDPYVFEADGSRLLGETAAQRTEQINYVNQLVATNAKVKQLIDVLLADTENSPIILLQSDHGPMLQLAEADPETHDWRTATPAGLDERSGIISAYHLPGAQHGLLYPSVSPVNSFRIVFNEYFRTQLALLPDRVFSRETHDRQLSFFEITSALEAYEEELAVRGSELVQSDESATPVP
jgi:hypothetical protein